MNNIVTVLFDVESEAYQGYAEMRSHMAGSEYLVSEAVLVKTDGKNIQVVESVDTGVNTGDDTAAGAVVGSIVGILGGPIGMLLGSGVGALAGGAIDAFDADADASLIEQVAGKIYGKQTAIIALVKEGVDGALDTCFKAYSTTIIRQDAAVVADEVEAARETERELERQAKAQMRAEKKTERQAKIDEHKAAIEARFEQIKAKGAVYRDEFQEGVDDFEAEAKVAKDKVFGK